MYLCVVRLFVLWSEKEDGPLLMPRTVLRLKGKKWSKGVMNS